MTSSLPPSFLFAGLDGETLKLNDELQSLGGGDAKTCSMDVFCCVNEKSEGDHQTVWDYDHSIGLRDVSLPRGHPSSSNMHYFAVSGSVKCNSNGKFSHTNLMTDLSDQVLNWVHDGFNACLVSTGMRGTGKTSTLFGDIGKTSYDVLRNSTNPHPPMVQQIFHTLFHHKKIATGSSVLSFALSAWMLQDNRIVDLMVPVSHTNDPLDFACIECPELNTTMQLLHEARSRAPGCLSWDPSQKEVDGNIVETQKAHFFCRIIVHSRPHPKGNLEDDSSLGVLSSLYISDLVGLTSVESKYFKTLHDPAKSSVRNRNQQLHTLFQILKEMQDMTRLAAATHIAAADQCSKNQPLVQTIKRPTSARNSKLTILLAPILQGNMKTTFINFMQDGENNCNEHKNVLQHVLRARDIVTACYKCKDIPIEWLNIRRYEDSLPVHFSNHSTTKNSIPFYSNATPIKEHVLSHEQPDDHSIHSGLNTITTTQSSNLLEEEANLESVLMKDFGESRASLSLLSLSAMPDQPGLEFFSSNNMKTPSRAGNPRTNSMGLLSIAKATPSYFQQSTPQTVVSSVATPRSIPKPRSSRLNNVNDAISGKVPCPPSSTTTTSDVGKIIDEFHNLMKMIETEQMETDLIVNGTPSTSAARKSPQGFNNRYGSTPSASIATVSSSSSLRYSTNSTPALADIDGKMVGSQRFPSNYVSEDILYSQEMKQQPSCTTRDIHNVPDPSNVPTNHDPHDERDADSLGSDSNSLSDEDSDSEESVDRQGKEYEETTPPSIKNTISPELIRSRSRVVDHDRIESQTNQEMLIDSLDSFRVHTHPSRGDPNNGDVEVTQRDSNSFLLSHHGMNTHQQEDSLDDSYNQAIHDQYENSYGIGASTAIPLVSTQTTPYHQINRYNDHSTQRLDSMKEGNYHHTRNDDLQASCASSYDESYDPHLSNQGANYYQQTSRHSLLSNSPSSSPYHQGYESAARISFPPPPPSTDYHDQESSTYSNSTHHTPTPRKFKATFPIKTASTSTGRNYYDKNIRENEDSIHSGHPNALQKAVDFIEETRNRHAINHRNEEQEESKQLPDENHNRDDLIDDCIPDVSSYSKSDSIPKNILMEVENLRRTKESLLEALKNEKQHRQNLELKLQHQQDDIVEMKAQYEVEIDTVRFENRQMKLTIQKICGDNLNLSDVYNTFEADMNRLMKENEMLRELNMELEAKELDRTMGLQSANPAVAPKPTKFRQFNKEKSSKDPQYHSNPDGSPSQQLYHQRLIEKLKKSGQEREHWKSQYEQLKSKERQFLMNEKMTHDAMRRLRVTHQELIRLKKENENIKLVLMKKESELTSLQEDTKGIRQTEYALKEERSRLLSEIQLLRMRILDFESEEHRAIQLSKFLNKHSPSTAFANASKGKISNNGTINNELHNNFLKAKVFAMDEVMRTQEKTGNGIGKGNLLNVPGVSFAGVESGNQSFFPSTSYQRDEEKDVVSADLELTMAAMHDSLVSNAPALLPLFRKLTKELHQERSLSIQQRAKLLDQVIQQGSGAASRSTKLLSSKDSKDRKVRIREELNTMSK